VSALRTVRSYANEPRHRAAFDAAVARTVVLGERVSLAHGAFFGTVTGLTTLATGALLYYGGRLVLDGALSVGSLTAFLIYALTVGGAAAGVAGVFGALMTAAGASERVFELLDRAPRIALTGGATLPRASLRGAITFTDVVFAYPSRPSFPVLRGLSLALAPGRVTALVGPSGHGKSTVVNLLEGFYRPDRGRVTVDDVDLASLDGSWWRSQVGLVRQEPVLFAGTIAENIRVGRPGASDADVERAAQVANAHGFIAAFPDGYATVVGERGVRLSGGQKQRVAIAACVLRDPVVAVLDEATASLDAEAEAEVTEALERLMAGRTVLVVAHRLSTVRHAAEVVVVVDGGVAARGPHEELLRTSDVYAALVRRQLAGSGSAGSD
jgi:ATP-binding cassette subfamily B protein